MQSVSWERTSSVMCRSAAMEVKAGATIDEDTGEMKVNRETETVAAHFFLLGQFFGFSGSLGPSQSTIFEFSRDRAGRADLDFLSSSCGCWFLSKSMSRSLTMPPRTSRTVSVFSM